MKRPRSLWLLVSLLAAMAAVALFHSGTPPPSAVAPAARPADAAVVAPGPARASSVPATVVPEDQRLAEEQAKRPALPRGEVVPKFIEQARVLERRETVEGNSLRRVKVVEADFKYPYLRVEETVVRDPSTGRELLLDHFAMVADHIMVKLRPNVPEQVLSDIAERHGGKILKRMLAPDLYLVQLEAHDLDTVTRAVEAFSQEVDAVAYAEPDGLVTAIQTFPDDTRFDELYGMHNTGQTGGSTDADIDAPEAWDLTQGNREILVGVIDTGVEYTHPDLSANCWTNPGESGLDGGGADKRTNGVDDDGNGFVDDYRGWDFYNDDNNPLDDHSHGTHCSGTIGGVGNNTLGVAGVCWRVSIVGIKFLSSGGGGTWSDAIDAMCYATLIRVKLSSNSWGGTGYSQGLTDAIEDADHEGILVVAAAGNNYNDTDLYPHYPSSYTNANIISVAATDHSDLKASFSCYGRTSVDLAAPGVNIISTVRGGGYASYSGTSMATPHVAGATALIWGLSPGATHRAIKNTILSTVDPIPAMTNLCVTGGRLNAYNAVREMKMTVADSDPAADAVVYAPPTDFEITLTDEYEPSSVAAADFAVNGTAADSVVLASTNRITFHYGASPVSTQGLQNMYLAEDVITRVRDGDGNAGWAAAFRYDALAMQVTNTVPADGSVVSMPFTTLRVQFNEAFDAGSVESSDLLVSQGSVAAAGVVDATTLDFTLAGITNEDYLDVTVPAGGLVDGYGNPNLEYNGQFILDVASMPLPVPMRLVKPAGALVYETEVRANMASGTDVDEFTLAADAGQQVTAVLDVGDALRGAVEIVDTTGASLGTVDGLGPGRAVVAGPRLLSGAGTCRFRVTSLDGTAGPYHLRVILNAAVELESHDGPSNGRRGAAQVLDGAGASAPGGAQRLAVLGRLVGGASCDDDFFRLDLASNEFLTFVVSMPAPRAGRVLEVEDALSHTLGNWVMPGDQVLMVRTVRAAETGPHTVRLSGPDDEYTLMILRGAMFDTEPNGTPALANQFLGDPPVVLGSLMTGLDPITSESEPNDDGSTGCTTNDFTYADDLTGSLVPISATQYQAAVTGSVASGYDGDWDFFKIMAAPGMRLEVYLGGSSSGGGTLSDPYLRLYSRTGSFLTSNDDGGTGLDSYLVYSSFSYEGEYYIVAESYGSSYGTYRMATTLISSNPPPGAADHDVYRVNAVAGVPWQFETMTPADGPQEFVNDLDPALELYTVAGTLVLSNANGAPDGRNARLLFTPVVSAEYRLKVTGENNAGEYALIARPRGLSVAVPEDVGEGDGVLPAAGVVFVDEAVAADTAVALLSGDTTEIAVPVSITIPSGATSAVFNVSVIDDALLDGVQAAMVSATAPGYAAGSAVVRVADDETAALSLSVPASASEGSGLLVNHGRVDLSAVPDTGVQVALFSDDISEACVPSSVTVPAGQTSAVFTIAMVDDLELDGTQTVAFTASVEGWGDAVATMQVLDNEGSWLSLTLGHPDYIESDGVLAGEGCLTIGGVLGTNLAVQLLSGDTTEVVVPAEVTICAGQTSAVFDVGIVDDAAHDGAQACTVTVWAAGFSGDAETVAVFDDELDRILWTPIGTEQARGIPFGVALRAVAADDVPIRTFTHSAALSGAGDRGPVTPVPATAGPFAAGVWSGSLMIPSINENVVLTAAYGGVTGDSNPFDVTGPVCDITPADLLDTQLAPNATTTRVLTVSNRGTGLLTFDIALTGDWMTFGERVRVSSASNYYYAVCAGDVDGDGDLDVLGTTTDTDDLLWWENTDGFGQTWISHTIDTYFSDAWYIEAADMDADGDLDVLSAAYYGDIVAWWENTTGAGTSWTRHTIASAYDSPSSAVAADLDGDGDLDVVGTARYYDDVVWWENLGGGTSWTMRYIDDYFDGAADARVADLDGDGDLDVVGAAMYSDGVACWINLNGAGTSWRKCYMGRLDGVSAIRVADLDGDGDPDAVGAGTYAYQLHWWENRAQGTSWVAHVLATNVYGPYSVDVGDFDGDGQADVVAGAAYGDWIGWWRNQGGGSAWEPNVVQSNVDYPMSVRLADLNGDGAPDVVAAENGYYSRAVEWWANRVTNAWLSAAPVVGSVAPGDATNILVTFNAAGCLPLEHREGTVWVRSNDTLARTNQVPVSMELLGPDLVISELSVTNPVLKLGETFPLRCVVRNQGVWITTNSVVQVRLSESDAPAPGDFIFENTGGAPPLAPGASWTNVLLMTMPDVGCWETGTARIVAVADATDRTPEGVLETNNATASAPITVLAPELLDIEIHPAGYPDDPSVPLGFDVPFTAVGHFEMGIVLELTTNVLWASSQTNVLAFDAGEPGVARSLDLGAATVHASYLGVDSAPQVVTVTDPVVTNLMVRPVSVPGLHVNETVAFDVYRQYSDRHEEEFMPDEWTTSDLSVAVITPNGVLLAVRAGTVVVRAVEDGEPSAPATVTISASISGRVTGDGAAVASAAVRYVGPVTGTVTGDAAGLYVTPWLPAGTYQVWAEHAAFLNSATSAVTLGPNAEHTDLNLHAPRVRIVPGGITNVLVPVGTARLEHAAISNAGSSVLAFELASREVTNALAMASGPGDPLVIALFYNSSYVDVGPYYYAEASNVKAGLEDAGHTVRTFTGITPQELKDALNGAQILYIPELEWRDLAPDLTAEARAVLADFVARGGGFIINAEYSNRDENLLNALFGWSVTSAYGYGTPTRRADAQGTAFEDDPASLTSNNGFYPWRTDYLPAEAKIIYGLTYSSYDYAGVVLLTHGSGRIVMLGWDWYDAVPVGYQNGGWLQVLASAIQEVRSSGVEEREATYGAWDMTWSGPLRDRGNIYRVEKAALLTEMAAHLELPLATDVKLFVYEAEHVVGEYNKLYECALEDAGPGDGWYASPPCEVLLQPGHAYYIGAAWQGNAVYGRGGASPQTTALGELVTGVAVTQAGWPPVETIHLHPVSGETAPYHQRLTFAHSPSRSPIWCWPLRGLVDPGAGLPIAVVFDASGLIAGEHVKREMYVTCNDPLAAETGVVHSMITLPQAPMMLPEPEYTSGASNTVYWTAVPGAAGYLAELAIDTQRLLIANSGWKPDCLHTFCGLLDGRMYSYRAIALIMVDGRARGGPPSDWVSSTQVADDGDLDGDGMPNGWEDGNGLDMNDPSDAGQDNDGDDADNRNEYVADTAPGDEASVLKIVNIVLNGERVRVEWQGGTQSRQYLLRCKDPVAGCWQYVYTNQPPTDRSGVFEHLPEDGMGSYSITAER